MIQLTAQNLSLGYEGKKIVSNLNFTVEKGDFIGVLGENGSGKSTLLYTLLGFKKSMEGRVVFTDPTKKGIGYLPQQADIQKNFPASVKEVVLSGCLTTGKWSPFYTAAQKVLAKKNMALLGIEEISKKSFSELSGGQKQRVLLARALCATKEIIMLDEPVSGLDPTVTVQLYDVLKKINREGITVIMVSHDVSKTLECANKILHIDFDKSFYGTTEENRAYREEGEK